MSSFAIGTEQDLLLRLSVQLGNNPLLVQASSGNTSLKIDGTLWIKASGKWLASAESEQIFVPLALSVCRKALEQGHEGALAHAGCGTTPLRPSIETFMHAVLPQRVVIHVHSVNAIAWAVRTGAENHLAEKLHGLSWQWIPYAHSGLPLAREIQSALRSNPNANVFILANHGLVVCADDCAAAEFLLAEVERRLTIPPRPIPPINPELFQLVQHLPDWQAAPDESVHFLGADETARRIASQGVLYPCQAMFLGNCGPDGANHFAVIEGLGVLIHNRITAATYAVLVGFAEVLRRLHSTDAIRYLSSADVHTILTLYAQPYKSSAANQVTRCSPR